MTNKTDKSLAMRTPLPDLNYLRSILSYDKHTGIFTNVVHRAPHVRAGGVAGSPNPRTGHIYIKIKGKLYQAHRIAWKFIYGRDPEGFVDHINRNPADNRAVNLRSATRSENNANTSRAPGPNGRGVRFSKRCALNPFYAVIGRSGKRTYLGYFATATEARAAYDKAANASHGKGTAQ